MFHVSEHLKEGSEYDFWFSVKISVHDLWRPTVFVVEMTIAVREVRLIIKNYFIK